MSRPSSLALGLPLGFALAFLVLATASGCGEDGKTTPSDCPQLPIYDIQGGAQGFDDPADCVTDVGHAVSSVGTPSSGGKNQTPNMAGAGGS